MHLSSTADTVSFGVVRRDRSGASMSGTCRLRRTRVTYDFLQPANGTYLPLCMSRGGFPFGMNGTTSYQDLNGPFDPVSGTVEIGGTSYAVETAQARFFYEASVPHDGRYASTRVQTVLAEGIGIVETTVTEGQSVYGTPIRRDTLRVRLTGAEVGGVRFGSFEPVASETGPETDALSVQLGPNPTRGPVVVRVVQGGQRAAALVRVIDVRGRVVREVRALTDVPVALDLTDLSAGIYLVQVESGRATAHTRIVVVE
ncbi:MAG TPA: T9SS type A sorting domain-containing protein [Rubricoccaceae bacterium]